MNGSTLKVKKGFEVVYKVQNEASMASIPSAAQIIPLQIQFNDQNVKFNYVKTAENEWYVGDELADLVAPACIAGCTAALVGCMAAANAICE